jgi:DNA repair photolyase
MDIIYEPTGKAKEYAGLACNLYNGCTHGCKYCYAKRYTHEDYNKAADPKKDALLRLQKAVEKLDANCPEILLSFQGDVYQPAENDLRLTRQALQVLRERNLPFTVLTKGGTRAVRDFDIIEGYTKARFGTTLIFIEQIDSDYWEPFAASIENRIKALKEARLQGIPTWISLEPVIDPDQAIRIVEMLHPIVDHWKVGKLNYHKEIEDKVDWIGFREKITALLNDIGASFYLKKSLTDLTQNEYPL